jgi:hypothetical protein
MAAAGIRSHEQRRRGAYKADCGGACSRVNYASMEVSTAATRGVCGVRSTQTPTASLTAREMLLLVLWVVLCRLAGAVFVMFEGVSGHVGTKWTPAAPADLTAVCTACTVGELTAYLHVLLGVPFVPPTVCAARTARYRLYR